MEGKQCTVSSLVLVHQRQPFPSSFHRLTKEPERKESSYNTSEHPVAEDDGEEPEKGENRRDEERRIDD